MLIMLYRCLLVEKELHCDVGGFRTDLKVAEDQNYISRISRLGNYCFTKTPIVRVSARRFWRDGLTRMFAVYTLIEIHRILVGEIGHNRFGYFGERRKLHSIQMRGDDRG